MTCSIQHSKVCQYYLQQPTESQAQLCGERCIRLVKRPSKQQRLVGRCSRQCNDKLMSPAGGSPAAGTMPHPLPASSAPCRYNSRRLSPVSRCLCGPADERHTPQSCALADLHHPTKHIKVTWLVGTQPKQLEQLRKRATNDDQPRGGLDIHLMSRLSGAAAHTQQAQLAMTHHAQPIC